MVAILGFFGICVTAYASVQANKNAKRAKKNMETGNGASAGEYLTRIDRKLDHALFEQARQGQRVSRIEGWLKLGPMTIAGGCDDDETDG